MKHHAADLPLEVLQQFRVIYGTMRQYFRTIEQCCGLPGSQMWILQEVERTPAIGVTELAQRLALAKAHAVARQFPSAVVIGSDQVADLHGEPLGKPGSHERAVARLRRMRGQTVVFQTAVAVVCQDTGFAQCDLAAVRVQFRPLSDAEIETYLQREKPYDCAGSAKSEGLGIALLSSIENDDPTALIGLPLIRTCRLIQAAGIEVLA